MTNTIVTVTGNATCTTAEYGNAANTAGATNPTKKSAAEVPRRMPAEMATVCPSSPGQPRSTDIPRRASSA